MHRWCDSLHIPPGRRGKALPLAVVASWQTHPTCNSVLRGKEIHGHPIEPLRSNVRRLGGWEKR